MTDAVNPPRVAGRKEIMRLCGMHTHSHTYFDSCEDPD